MKQTKKITRNNKKVVSS